MHAAPLDEAPIEQLEIPFLIWASDLDDKRDTILISDNYSMIAFRNRRSAAPFVPFCKTGQFQNKFIILFV